MPPIETVTGQVDDADLGLTLAHEHLSTTSEPVRAQWPHLYDYEQEVERALEQVRAAMDRGVKTIVEPSCMDLGRDVRLCQRVAEETGIQLVMCTGIYGAQYTFIPHYFQNRDPSALVDAFVHDIEEGIQGTEVKAAFLKCAVDEPGVTPDVERVLRAAAQASKRTGRPIMAHSHPATRRGLEIMDIFDDEGIDPRKVQIAHTGDTDDLEYIEALLARGPWIGMDRYGLDIFLPTAQRNATVIELCKRGYADRMTLSQDACATLDWYPEELKPQLAPEWDFTFLWRGVLPELSDGGVTDDQIDTMMRENPRGWLTA
ncbi:MAG: phosphotriesterase-related protein [Solirubrobacteraceae bacterium]|jgi:phosphotriesterase-related protein|nr:phosphotriesterase-related protein [Solirubrobacteraceae bacterium]